MSDYVLLTVVIIVLIIGAIKGYRKGCLRLAVWFAGLVAVLFIVTKISPYVSDFLVRNTSIDERIRARIITAYENRNDEEAKISTVSENEEIDSFGFPALITDSIKTNNTSEIYDKLAVTIFRDYVSEYLTSIAIKAGTFVGLFIILAVAELILILAIRILERIPVLKTFNRLLGMATGITLSLVFIWIFFLAAMMFFGQTFGGWVISQVKASAFLTYLYNNNILFALIR